MLFRKIVLLLLLSPCILYGQVIKNGGFEANLTSTLPNSLSQVDQTTDWIEASSSAFGPHTVDWLASCNTNQIRIFEEDPITSNLVLIDAHSDCGYAGMLGAELFQQEIGELDEDNLGATLQMYIRLPNKWRFTTDPPNDMRTPLWIEQMEVSVFMAKEKITYSNNDDHCFEDSGSGYEKDGDGLTKVAFQPITTSAYPTGQWHLVELSFKAPSKDHDWVAFEFFIPYEGDVDLCTQDYLMVDDVSIEFDACEDCFNCTPYDGCLDISVGNLGAIKFDLALYADGCPNPCPLSCNGNQNFLKPLQLLGLSNAKYVKLEIGHLQVAGALRTIEVFYPRSDILAWDFKNDSGINVSAGGTFQYRYTAFNNCDEVTSEWEDFTISILEGTIPPCVLTFEPRFDYSCGYLKPPPECCNRDIFIAMEPQECGSLTLDGDLDFITCQSIFISDDITLTPGSNINFTAQVGGVVVIEPGVTIPPEVTINIENCTECFGFAPPPNPGPNKNKLEQDFEKRVNRQSEEPIISNKLFDIQINPNPVVSKLLNIQVLNHQINSSYTFEIYDSLGKMVYYNQISSEQENIDLSLCSKGIYYIQLWNNDHSVTKKFVIQ